jgi:hypothetical protein
MELNAPGGLNFSKEKKIKDGGRYVVGLYLENCLRKYIDKNIFPLNFGVWNSVRKSVEVF